MEKKLSAFFVFFIPWDFFNAYNIAVQFSLKKIMKQIQSVNFHSRLEEGLTVTWESPNCFPLLSSTGPCHMTGKHPNRLT